MTEILPSGDTGLRRRRNIRSIYLSSVGTIFLIANLSYYVQFPGLLSSVGVEPAASRVIPKAFPDLQQLLEQNDVDGDSFIETLCMIGVVLSSIVASGLVQHGSLFAVLTAIYYFLTTTGGQMYSFQWDILLTEVGGVTAMCCAPWHQLNYIRKPNGNSIGAWPVRFLLFKLMFMSGVVKIQANCPTWLNLTALEYHFATQCLPGPLAWHAQQLHPFFLRLSVAATFVIEIPAAFLLIAPIRSFRIVGAWLQIMLQVVIILTGSYNFFNLLTIVMCLPCFEDDAKVTTSRPATKIFKTGQYIACLLHLVWATTDMCHFESIDNRWNVKLAWSKVDTDTYINATLPWVIPLVFVFVGASCLWQLRSISESSNGMVKKSFGSVGALLQLTTCCFFIGVLSIPMLDLTPQLHHDGCLGSRFFSPYWPTARQYHLSSGYGLFRRMTGVGKASGPGWAGLTSPSVVARPEIIVEAQLQDKDGGSVSDWKELKFRWKPGDLRQMPLQVAPHQPRLDWRMWFAALGSYNHNPWFVAFLDRLLNGCSDAAHLLNEPDIEAGKKRIVRIRSNLYTYDFTRIDSEWSRTIPGATILKDGKVLNERDGNATHLTRMGWWEEMVTSPRQYWSRTLVKEYTPAIKVGDASVQEFMKGTGYLSTCAGKYTDRCSAPAKGGRPLHPLCSLTVLIRQRHLIWLPVFFLALVWRWRLGTFFRGEYYHWYSQRGGILVIGPPKNEQEDGSVQKKEQ